MPKNPHLERKRNASFLDGAMMKSTVNNLRRRVPWIL